MYILEKIKIEGVFADLIAKSNGENVMVRHNGSDITLASAIAELYETATTALTPEEADTKIAAAIGELTTGAPEAYDTLKEIGDYLTTHEDLYQALKAASDKKVDAVDGKGLSTEDFTALLKQKLESLPEITAQDVESWNAKASTDVATTTANGLMSKEDKTRLDGIRGVRYGAEPPEDMQDGEMFVRVVE